MKNCKYCKELRIAKSEFTLKDHSNECYCDEEIYMKNGEAIGRKSGLKYDGYGSNPIDPDGAEHQNLGPY